MAFGYLFNNIVNSEILISRSPQMLHKAVIINGFPGCGKTMLSPIVSAFDRVEIMQYAPVIEQMCELWGLDSIDEDVAKSMIKMNADMLIYNITMGRNSNCRPSDLSSIFKHKPLTHIRRMLAPGDLLIPDIVRKNKPRKCSSSTIKIPLIYYQKLQQTTPYASSQLN